MMKSISTWKQELTEGAHAARLAALYCCTPDETPAQAARYAAVLDGLEPTFGAHTEAGLYSAPGRTEIGGNHTDHQHGRVLAGSVNIDMIAAAAPNDKNQLRVQSEGYDLCVNTGNMDISDVVQLTLRYLELRVRRLHPAGRKAGRSGRLHLFQRAEGQRRLFFCRL